MGRNRHIPAGKTKEGDVCGVLCCVHVRKCVCVRGFFFQKKKQKKMLLIRTCPFSLYESVLVGTF